MDLKRELPGSELRALAKKNKVGVLSKEFATLMDERDPLREFRSKFAYPRKSTLPGYCPKGSNKSADEECVYLCGNSLGLKPKAADTFVMAQLDKWAHMGVHMHFEDPLPAFTCDKYSKASLGHLVGAAPSTVTLMNGLTVNLQLLMVSFYHPTKQRYKIMIEAHAFPSDRYAMESQARLHGYDPDTVLLQIKPRQGEELLRHEDIIETLEKEGSSIAVVCLSGVQYYTGQLFDMAEITAVAQKQGCLVGWDLAHAVGNVEICLDKWGADFACWCTYKYLNGGPGCIAGAYVNSKHNTRHSDPGAHQLLGWWSNKEESRLEMRENCDIADGVDGFRLCNPPVVLVALVEASLQIFEEAGMPRLLEKQRLLTGYLELLMQEYFCKEERPNREPLAKIITSHKPEERGCQLSLCFSSPLQGIHDELSRRGIVCDVRKPNVMRIAPAPLYNSFQDVYKFITILKDLFESLDQVSANFLDCRPLHEILDSASISTLKRKAFIDPSLDCDVVPQESILTAFPTHGLDVETPLRGG